MGCLALHMQNPHNRIEILTNAVGLPIVFQNGFIRRWGLISLNDEKSWSFEAERLKQVSLQSGGKKAHTVRKYGWEYLVVL